MASSGTVTRGRSTREATNGHVPREQTERDLLRVLKKRQSNAKDIHELAEELGFSAYQSLSRPVAKLVAEGKAVRTERRDPKRRFVYTKA